MTTQKRKAYKFLTLNINSINARFQSFKTCILKHKPDVIMLQEIKCEDYKFPSMEIMDLGYKNIIVHGQKSYNGVAILTNLESSDAVLSFDGNTFSDDARYIETTLHSEIGDIRTICVYCPNGSPIDSEKYYRKLDFFKNLKDHLIKLSNSSRKILLAGDINIAPYDEDVYDASKLQNSIAFTLKERIVLREILNSGFTDCYRALNKTSEFSWFDYRGGSLQNRTGFRIDKFLVNNFMIDHLKSCYIDMETRENMSIENEKPSDHCPVIAEFSVL